MNRPLFALIWVAIVAIIFLAMWLGWRARSRRDASVATAQVQPTAALIAEFDRVLYVSTTPVGEPLTRVAAPGLRYRGQCEIAVYEDGVTVQIDGEAPVHFAAAQLRGSGTAGRRVGKAVEDGGLALMRWVDGGTEHGPNTRGFESSFRFESRPEQLRFASALDQITDFSETSVSNQTATSQEDEK